MEKSILLLFVIILGIFLPFADLISYGLIIILFFAFLEERLERKMFFEKKIIFILLANIVI
jgi:hypothetical protein